MVPPIGALDGASSERRRATCAAHSCAVAFALVRTSVCARAWGVLRFMRTHGKRHARLGRPVVQDGQALIWPRCWTPCLPRSQSCPGGECPGHNAYMRHRPLGAAQAGRPPSGSSDYLAAIERRSRSSPHRSHGATSAERPRWHCGDVQRPRPFHFQPAQNAEPVARVAAMVRRMKRMRADIEALLIVVVVASFASSLVSRRREWWAFPPEGWLTVRAV
jgi:hypothetical protein